MVIKLPRDGSYKSLLSYLLVLATPLAVFSWHLSSQTKGYSLSELSNIGASKLSEIGQNPLFLPYKLLENLLFHISHGHRFGIRFTSVIFGMIFSFMFFYMLKSWFGKPIAILSTLLFSLTPMFLLSSRIATPVVLYAYPIALLGCYFLYTRSKENKAFLYLFLIVALLGLYIPGLIWLYLISIIFWYKKLRLPNDLSRKVQLSCGALILVFILPLILSFAHEPKLITNWLLLPDSAPKLLNYLKNFFWSISGLFVKSRDLNPLNLEKLPLFNAAQLGLFVFGVYVMWERLRRQLYWLVSCLLAICLLSSFSGSGGFIISAIPFVGFLCGMGLRYLFIEWRKIFPRNPLAKWFAIALMFCIIGMHIAFGVRYALVAWPSNTAVKQIYMLK